MKRTCCLALALLFALAAPAVLLAAEAPVQPAASPPANAAGSACAPAPSAVDGLFPPVAASPPATPWDQRLELTSCDCSGFDCGPNCYPYVCVLLHGRCGAICKCNP